MFNRKKVRKQEPQIISSAATTVASLLDTERQYQESFKQAYAEALSFRSMIQSIHADILSQAMKEKYYEPLEKLQDIFQEAYNHYQDWVEFYYITLFCSDGTTYTLVDKGASLFYLTTSDNDPMAALIAALAPNKSLAGKLTYSYATDKVSFQLDIFSGELRILSTAEEGSDKEIHKQVVGFANLQLHPRGIKDWDHIFEQKKDLGLPLPSEGKVPLFRQLTLLFEGADSLPPDFFSSDPADNSSSKLMNEMQDAIDTVGRAITKTIDSLADSDPDIPITKEDIKKHLKEEKEKIKKERLSPSSKPKSHKQKKVYDA